MKLNVNVEYMLITESILISPPIFSVIILQIHKPSPIPLELMILWVSTNPKRVNNFYWSLAVIPVPLSLTDMVSRSF